MMMLEGNLHLMCPPIFAMSRVCNCTYQTIRVSYFDHVSHNNIQNQSEELKRDGKRVINIVTRHNSQKFIHPLLTRKQISR